MLHLHSLKTWDDNKPQLVGLLQLKNKDNQAVFVSKSIKPVKDFRVDEEINITKFSTLVKEPEPVFWGVELANLKSFREDLKMTDPDRSRPGKRCVAPIQAVS